MKRATFLSTLLGLGVAVVTTVLAGCGGGGSNNAAPGAATRGKGTVQMVIKWPEPAASRLIPEAAKSIQVVVTGPQGEPVIARQTVARPAAGQNETTVTFPEVPAGQVRVSAAAYPNPDGTGAAQAAGSIVVEVSVGKTTDTPPLTLDSTITELRVTPPENLTLEVGQQKTFSVSAHNAQGEMVLTTPNKFAFVIAPTNPQVAFLFNETDGDASASLRADNAGTAALTITERESGKTLQATVTVKAATPVGPRIINLGATAGGSVFGGYALTNGLDDARVVGQESPPGIAAVAIQYQNGALFNIGTIGDAGSGTTANDINNSNHVVGTANSQNLGSAIPFLFRDVNGNRQADAGEMVSLGFVGEAEAINDANVIVGTKIDAATNARANAFVSSNGTVTDLTNLGGASSRARDINANGLVVGSAALTSGQSHACFWQPQAGGGYGVPVDLGVLPGSTESSATAVNATGVIVGNSFVPDPAGGPTQVPRAFVTTISAGGLTELPRLNATDRSSEALGINSNGDIVGRINVGTGPTEFNFVAVRWTKDAAGAYQVVNLNTLHGTGWNLRSAQDINDQGVITGNGISPLGPVRAYLFLP